MDHVSAPYNSVERTKASYNLIFVRKLRPLSLHIFVNLPNTQLAFPYLGLMSLSQLHDATNDALCVGREKKT